MSLLEGLYLLERDGVNIEKHLFLDRLKMKFQFWMKMPDLRRFDCQEFN